MMADDLEPARIDAAKEAARAFVENQPGSILIGPMRELARRFPNQEEITVKGIHFIQEDSPADIGGAVAGFIRKHA